MLKLVRITGTAQKKLLVLLPDIMQYMENFIKCHHSELKFQKKHIYTFENGGNVNKDIRVMTACDNEYFNCKVLGGVDTLYATKMNGVNILFDLDKMKVISLIDAKVLTAIRTAVMSGIALKHLSPHKTSRILIIGAGYQCIYQVCSIAPLFSDIEIYVFDKNLRKVKQLIDVCRKCNKNYNIKSVQEKLEDITNIVDAIVTLTPSRKPLIFKSHIRGELHINAIGADTNGKQELDPEILREAKIIVDDINQSLSHGELNIPHSNGILSKEDIYATIIEIILGNKRGRENNDKITVFDSTGLPLLDLVVHRWIYEKYSREGKI